MSRETWGYAVWGALMGVGLILELLGVFKLVPWPSLSATTINLIQRTNGWAAIAVVGGLAILVVHIVLPDAFNPKKKKS